MCHEGEKQNHNSQNIWKHNSSNITAKTYEFLCSHTTQYAPSNMKSFPQKSPDLCTTLFQKRPGNSGSLKVAAPYMYTYIYIYVNIYGCILVEHSAVWSKLRKTIEGLFLKEPLLCRALFAKGTQQFREAVWCSSSASPSAATHCNTLQHTATRCNTLQQLVVAIWRFC